MGDWKLVIVCGLVALFGWGCPPDGGAQPAPTPDPVDAGGESDTEADNGDDEPEPADILFDQERFVVEIGSATDPEAQVVDADGEPIDEVSIEWTSEDPSIIEISSGGMAIANEVGETQLVAQAGEVQVFWPAQVVETAVAAVTVLPQNQEIVVGQAVPYSVELRDATNGVIEGERPVDWSVEDPEVAQVDDEGSVEGVAEGQTEVVAQVEGVEGRGELSVEDVEVHDIEIEPASVGTLDAGETLQLEAIAYDIEDNEIGVGFGEWSSSAPEVASVSAEGLVEGLDVGEATISVAFEQLEDSVDVEVVFELGEVASGDGFACAVGGSRLFCVGQNAQGQLGDGTDEGSDSAVEVQFDGDIEAVSAGGAHGCLVDGNGDVHCWGANDEGQLDGTPGDFESQPVEVDVGETFVDVSAGGDHSCGVTDSGEVYCWGANDDHQLGSSEEGDSGPVEVSGSVGFTEVAAGDGHSCAVGTNESGYCWGANDRGQLGGSTDADNSASPQLVDGGYQFGTVSAGAEFTCGIHPSGPPVCWGANDRGQLGVDSTVDQDVPLNVALDTGESLTSIAAGAESTCGTVIGGKLRCWGAHDDGRLGVDRDDDATSPTVVDDDEQFTSVSAGADHGCGTTLDDRLLCWGGSPGEGAGFANLAFDW